MPGLAISATTSQALRIVPSVPDSDSVPGIHAAHMDDNKTGVCLRHIRLAARALAVTNRAKPQTVSDLQWVTVFQSLAVPSFKL